VLDLVGGARQLSTAWIKELHALITRSEKTTTAVTPDGTYIQVPLLHGDWKRQPNNPKRPDGGLHEYCPPEHVASEMDRLVEVYAAAPPEFPEVRAAWLHHAFTQIHPFQDGNGRVARALASIDFIRAGLFPLLVDRSDRDRVYIPALERADHGDLAPLVAFFAKCQERVLTKAISEAEVVVGQEDSLAAVLAAATSKVLEREQTEVATRQVMAGRINALAALAAREMKKTGDKTKAQVPGVTARTELHGPTTAHYFRAQVTDLARKHGYWADLREPRSWARLQLRDGGITDVVVALHFVGNPSPGVCVSAMFLEHRDQSDPKELSEVGLVDLGVEPLLLAADEDERAQRERFLKWLADGQIRALAQWTKYL